VELQYEYSRRENLSSPYFPVAGLRLGLILIKMEGELRSAILGDDLTRVRLLVKGGASIAGTHETFSALHWAAILGRKLVVAWLLAEGGANITEVNDKGYTALLSAALKLTIDNVKTVQWLLEHGKADITDTAPDGQSVWDLLRKHFVASAFKGVVAADRLTALLRVMVLQGAPPVDLVVHMHPQHSQVAEEGARLRAGLPAYLARRRALLAEHTSLIAPLRALVSGYEEPTTTEELWATGLGALP
jgi:hypothetical protein